MSFRTNSGPIRTSLIANLGVPTFFIVLMFAVLLLGGSGILLVVIYLGNKLLGSSQEESDV